jgi:hypothetical protein
MPPPVPPVGLKDQCAVVFNNILYVYSPDAFQSIELKEDAKWEEHSNGVATRGAACVLGGVNGDNTKRALYVVGGTSNASNTDYTGLQRFDFDEKTWSTIEPVVQVTKDRLRHGANYIPSTNSLVIYGGSTVPGYDGLSSETFSIDLKEPYPVQAYDSTAPPVSQPFVMPWGDDSVVMVGGSDTNVKVFTFTTAGGWVEFAVELPNPLPAASVAQAAMYTLQDGSKILQTFQLGQEPIQVLTNVLLNPGAVPGTYGQVAGTPIASAESQTPSAAALARRQFLSNYPAYNSSSVPDTTRTDFSLAQGSEGLVAFVGGNEDSPVQFYNQARNTWVSAQALLGDQQPLRPTTTSSSTPSATPTSSTRPSASASESPAAPGGDSGNNSNTFEILGGVLGGICGLVAILIILLLFLRNKKRKQRREAASNRKSYPAGKKASSDFDFEEGMHPLREHGQPMGRSPVNSQVLERSSAAMFSSRPNENLVRRISSDNRMQPETQQHKSTSAAYAMFAREKSPLAKSSMAISKPMNPYLGDYQERPSIDLGRATPASPVNATALAVMPSRNKSNRKTEEAWGKYFAGGRVESAVPEPTPVRPTTSRGGGGGGGGFWPGSGVPAETPKSPKFAFRDSAGNTLQTRSVGTASPALENGPGEAHTHYLASARPKTGRISNANSMSSEGSDYEDEALDPAFSSGIPASVQGDSSWNAAANAWSGPTQRPLRSFSQRAHDYQPPLTAQTSSSGGTSMATGSSGGIPNFPMPGSTPVSKPMISQVQHPAATHVRSMSRGQQYQDGYFPPVKGHRREISNDTSWLDLGANNGGGR